MNVLNLHATKKKQQKMTNSSRVPTNKKLITQTNHGIRVTVTISTVEETKHNNGSSQSHLFPQKPVGDFNHVTNTVQKIAHHLGTGYSSTENVRQATRMVLSIAQSNSASNAAYRDILGTFAIADLTHSNPHHIWRPQILGPSSWQQSTMLTKTTSTQLRSWTSLRLYSKRVPGRASLQDHFQIQVQMSTCSRSQQLPKLDSAAAFHRPVQALQMAPSSAQWVSCLSTSSTRTFS